MPLDDFQKEIASLIRANRTPENVFAGGSVIQQHGIRLSEDQDIFTVLPDLDKVAQCDVETLASAGYSATPVKSYDGFREFLIVKPQIGRTTLQWTHGLTKEYFEPVSDSLFGYRLHYADLAVNKALAGASRQRVRDFIDLWMIDRHVIPLWRLACAAPGKDNAFNPFSLIERIARNLHFTLARSTEEYQTTLDVSYMEFGSGLRDSIDEARDVLRTIRPEHYGKLALRDATQPELARKLTEQNRWIAPQPGGCMPAFADMDSEMIALLIAEFGPEGSRLTGSTSLEPAETDAENWEPPDPSPFD